MNTVLGKDVGTVIGMSVAGVLCDYGFAGGWPSVFYVFGMAGCIWSIAWFLIIYDTPPSHPLISTGELDYWERAIGTEDLSMRPPTPWRAMLTSVPVWALSIASLTYNWGYFTLATCLPMYMNDVLGFSWTHTGTYSAVPFLASFVMYPVCGTLADWLRAPGRLSTTTVRKLFCVVAFVSSGCLLCLTSYFGCDRVPAVTTLFAVMTCMCIGMPVVYVNQLDLAPLHAGKVMGLTYTVGNLGAIGATVAVGGITNVGRTVEEWQEVFILAALVNGFGALVFVIFGSGERQSWAD